MEDKKEPFHCLLCGENYQYFSTWVETESTKILRCERCGLGFIDPKNSNNLKKINIETYNSRSYYNLLLRKHNQLVNRYKHQIKEIIKITSGRGKLLDVGCGIGLFLNTASSFGFKAYGYDVNKVNLNLAKKFFDVKILPDNFLDSDKFNNFFDVITLWDVLEHMSDYFSFLSKLILKLKPGGLLVVQCPNMGSYEFEKFRGNWNWLTPGDHLLFFTPKSLVHALTKVGLHPIKMKIWLEGLEFSNAMINLKSKDPTLIINLILFRIINKSKELFKKFNLNFPIEKIQSIYGWILQMTHHAGKKDSLIKVYAIKTYEN